MIDSDAFTKATQKLNDLLNSNGDLDPAKVAVAILRIEKIWIQEVHRDVVILIFL